MVCANCRQTFAHLPASVPCPVCGSKIKTFDPGLTQVWSPGMSAIMPERTVSAPAPRHSGASRAVNYSSRSVGLGLLLEVGGVLLMRAHSDIGAYALLAGVLLFMAGLCWYAESKGYSAVLGMLGLLSLFGLLILLLLPAKQTRNT